MILLKDNNMKNYMLYQDIRRNKQHYLKYVVDNQSILGLTVETDIKNALINLYNPIGDNTCLHSRFMVGNGIVVERAKTTFVRLLQQCYIYTYNLKDEDKDFIFNDLYKKWLKTMGGGNATYVIGLLFDKRAVNTKKYKRFIENFEKIVST